MAGHPTPQSSYPLPLTQDSSGALRGQAYIDFFGGHGDEAGQQASAMKQRGRMWVLLPHDYPIARDARNGPLAQAGTN